MASVDSLRRAVSSRDPYGIAKALELPPLVPPKTGASWRASHTSFSDSAGADWSNVLNAYGDACEAAKAGDMEKCYQSQSALHSAFNHLIGSSKGNLLIPALHVVCRNTHVMAHAADEAAQQDQSKMQNAVTLLQESFSKCLNDRKEYTVRTSIELLVFFGRIFHFAFSHSCFVLFCILNQLISCHVATAEHAAIRRGIQKIRGALYCDPAIQLVL